MNDEIAGGGEQSFEHKLRLRLAGMFWVIVGGLLSLIVAALVWFSIDQDRRAQTMSERIASSAVQARLNFLSKTIRDYSVWDDAYDHIVATADPKWIDGNVGPFVFDSLHFESSFITDESGKPIYAMRDGKVLNVALPQSGPGGEIVRLAREAAKGGADGPFARLARIDGKIAMVAVGRVAPSTKGRLADPSRVRMLVFVDRFDGEVLDEMSRIYLLPGLNIGTGEAENGIASIPLRDSSGQSLSALEWRQDRPGHSMLKLIAPIVACLALLVAMIGSRLMRHIRGMVGQMLADRRKAEDAIERARLALAAANAAQVDAANARRQLEELELAHRQLEDLRHGAWQGQWLRA